MRWLRQNLGFLLFMLGLLIARSSFADHFGGDVLEVRDGHALVNGVAHDEKAALELRMGGGPDIGPLRVPEGHVFVMGDFRGNSRDSRFFGFVREDQIYARAARVYYRSGNGFVWLPL